ncbi:ATP-binding protein [Luteitalea sp. TBR-22]|uniref:hybrid sensor histidine kinase/response regulator n=1 Tax=Luteitalea sp. TBR-22 TaxID=2802971 RepID=UPI001EF5B27D|nr:ATP-binding protein [Luteitalea sp. TBR-22]
MLFVAGAVLCRLGLLALGAEPRSTTFGPFYGAIVLAALVGGLGPGIVALMLSAAASAWLWVPGAAHAPLALLPFLVFLIVGGSIVWLTHLTGQARLRAERAEHRVQTVLDSITDGFVAVDFSWRYTYVNDAAQRYFGRREDELIGRVCWDVFPQALGTPLEHYYREVMEQRVPVTVELPTVLRPGGWSQLHVSPTAEGISVVFRDVTEARQLREQALSHQERLHRALASARMAAWEYDPRADRVRYGASASDVLGIPADQLPTNREEGTALIHPDDRPAHVARIREASRSADGQYQSQYRLSEAFLQGREGPVWIEDRGRLLFDAVGELVLVQGVMQDVTPQRATEERIRALNQDLRERIAERQLLLEAAEASREAAERSSRAKDEFLAVLSHELRSPMQSVLGWVQVLRTGPLDATHVGRALDTIERNLRQQTQLINDMLDVSRIVSGKLVFHLSTLPLASVVRETVDELRPLAADKGLEVSLEVSGDPFVVADRERVRQVISNLFTNAVKFTPAGGSVHVACGLDQGQARLEVCDTGEGIDPSLLPSIFERFQQADTSSTREHEGLGLGLSITRYIVEHLGGSISASSEGRGRGSSFVARLPLAHERRADAPAPRADVARQARLHKRLAGVDILVVDDHADTVELIAFVLEREGALVRTARSAREAEALWAERPARILVSDLSMPTRDGFALLAAIGGGAVPAIALSGLARADDRQRALEAGFLAHLAKPVEPGLLVETLVRLADGQLAAPASRP